MASSTKSIVKSSYASSWNVQVGEIVLDWTKIGDMSTVDYHLIGQVKVPANSYILDVQVHGVALWVSGAAVSLIVGDGNDSAGFHEATDLKATALLAGEANTMEHPGGLAGAYTELEQRAFYSASSRTVIADVTVTANATAASAGETRILVMYCCPPTDSVKP